MTDTTQHDNPEAIFTDTEMDRHYIPVHPDWEIQTKGKGSSFRIAQRTPDGNRWLVGDTYLHKMLEQMAREINSANLCRDEELARLRERDLAQQARIAQMRDGLLHYSDIRPDTPSRTVVLSEEGAIARKALATTDDLSALKAHDDALWNEALTTGIEWQATRGHTLDADDYENELRSLKR